MRLLRPPSREGPAAQHRSSWPVAARPKGLCQRHYYNYYNYDNYDNHTTTRIHASQTAIKTNTFAYN